MTICAAFKRKAGLSRIRSGTASRNWGRTVCLQVPRQPIQYIRSQPANLPALIAALLGKAAQEHQPGDDQLGSARKSRDVVGAEEFLNGRRGLIDPGREGYFHARGHWLVRS